MEAAVAAAVGEQRQRCGEVGAAMARLLHQKEADLAALGQRSAALQAELGALTQALTAALASTSSASTSALQARPPRMVS